jgi:phenylacetate-coenzyme A ligase PaaK-like adenylate-forming protein
MNAPDFSAWLDVSPYSMPQAEKDSALAKSLVELTEWHMASCPEYNRIVKLLRGSQPPAPTLAGIPFIPARLFKEYELRSVPKDHIFKILTSSGTTGQAVSRIILDKETAAFQTRILTRLMGDVLGKKRLPMLVIDSPNVLKDRLSFSARGAGILGFSLFGQNVTYALDEAMQIDIPAIEAFLERHKGQAIFLFGFTFMIWQYFYQPLKSRGVRLGLDGGILLHGGGWKKLQDQSVSPEDFSKALHECAGIRRVINYYGMVEQTGSIYLECEHGRLHAPVYSDVVVRRPRDFKPASIGETGLVEVLSLIPRSYPGHALLTEDLGRVDGEDDCPCGRLGKHFSIVGRIPKAENRGCSDTYEDGA